MAKRLLFILVLLLTYESLQAQRGRGVDYINLINRSSVPQYFLDHVVLPTEDGNTNLSIIFRFDNDFLPYKRKAVDEEITLPEGAEYYTIARLSAEIYEGKASRRRRNSADVNVVSRDMWIDTLHTNNFERANSNEFYASGSLSSELEQGEYNYVLQLNLMESTDDRNSENQNIEIFDWSTRKTGEIYFGKEIQEMGDTTHFVLSNIGDNVWYSKDFYALIRIPNYDSETEYTVSIDQSRVGRRDTTIGESVYSQSLSLEHIFEGALPVMLEGEDPTIAVASGNSDHTYAIVKIPNSEFQNAAYTLRVKTDGSDDVIASQFFRSYWQNMPASLLNLDVSIDHLKYILDEEKVKQIKDGGPIEKERKFREFWEVRDPTPGTVYNELMAEYYRRIDYAFEEFGTRANMYGQDSDRGKVYISYGPPENTERQFPTSGNVIEIWSYGDRRFVFENQNPDGFAEFILVSAEG